MRTKLRILKYLPFLLCIYTSIYAQEGILKIDRSLKTSIRLKEIKILKTESLKMDHLDIDINSKEWDVIQLGENAGESINSIDGIFWLFTEIHLSDLKRFEKKLTIKLINIGLANEIFWDNKMIGKKGSIGKYDEIDTQRIQIVDIPFDYESPGYHRLLIKVFNDKRKNFSLTSEIVIGFHEFFNERELERQIEKRYMRIFFMAVLFAAALYNLVLFFGFGRNTVYLFFSLYCLAHSRKTYFMPFKMFENFGEAFISGNIYIIFLMYLLANISLLAYLIIKFSFHKTHKVISTLILLLPAIALIAPENLHLELVHYVIIKILPFIIVLYALYRKKEHSLFILVGLALASILTVLDIVGQLWNGDTLGVLFFVICISILSSKEIATQNRKHREAVLRTARLENELLKRNIQPHFILNTLTSLQELVEQSPKKATKLIQALAEEFQLFSKVSGEKLISISDELKICNAHLRIMEFRKDTKYVLSTQGIKGTEKIPPGIFHTLIENGTTHGYASKKNGQFILTKESRKRLTRYILFNDSENEDIQEVMKKGTGLKYIETRLEESFPGLWKLTAQRVDNGWKVVIDIYEN